MDRLRIANQLNTNQQNIYKIQIPVIILLCFYVNVKNKS